jgi:subtilisin family serine protease
MRSGRWIGVVILTLGACSPARTASRPTVAPPPPPATDAPPATPPPATDRPSATPPAATAPVLLEAPSNWQLLEQSADGVPGTGVERAYRELLADREPARTVVVAVIDGGVDTAHVDLRDHLWRNPNEVAGNGVDDDGNGYVDDVFGWNFIGGPDGASVHHDTYEVTRLHALCTGAPAAPESAAAPASCPAITADFESERAEASQLLTQIAQIATVLDAILPQLRAAAGTDSLTAEVVEGLPAGTQELQRARSIFLQLAANGITPRDVEEARIELESRVEYKLNPEYNPRASVGDDYADLTERTYGNRDVTGPDAKHGTHVAGIIGAVRGNGTGIDGIAPVRIMAVRAVPDGDERDKDVANAIRYAADNGAHIVNMSFGKAYSPEKEVVDEAVKYAESMGVLLIHAAGNDGADLAAEPSFPTRAFLEGGTAANWIEVGASSWMVDSLAARFSNYGAAQVDLFAPGVDILSTVPGDGYERQDGTSMAAPVVTGVAALIMAYYPDLDAADVKRLLLETANSYADRAVMRPGGGDPVPFGTLSATGGVVDAYAALRRAAELAGSR